MLSVLKRAAGCLACTRLCYIAVEHRGLDVDELSNPTVRDPNNAVDRVLKIFDRDDFGCISPEASWVCVSTFVGLVFGGLHGGIRHAFIQRYQHLERNEATLYDSQRVALRTLMDKIHLGFIRGFFAHGFRVGFMIFTIVGTSTVLSSYRNKASVLDYTAGGVLAGSIYKFSLGPKGMVAGGFFGGFLATICGVMWVAMLKLSGIPLSEYYGQTHRYFRARDEQFHQAFKTHEVEPDHILHFRKTSAECPAANRLDELEDLNENSLLKYGKSLKINLK